MSDMRRIFIASWMLLGLGVATPGWSAVVPDQVFKVVSIDPSTAVQRFGSGLLLREQGRLFVLTSDHVIFRGPSPYRHFVQNARWGKFEAQYRFADWGRGIALLELGADARMALADFNLDEWKRFGTPRDLRNSNVRVLGYPAASNALVDLGQGKASSPLFIYGMTSSLRNMAYVTGSYAEFGMSGGPVLLASGEFQGVLSHLFVSNGTASEGDWSAMSRSPILVVPYSEIVDTLQAFFDSDRHEAWEYFQPEQPGDASSIELRTGRLEIHIGVRPDLGMVRLVEFTLLPTTATPRLPFPLLGAIQSAMIAVAPANAIGKVFGVRMEKSFRYMDLLDCAFVNFHQFAEQSYWGNVRPVVYWGERTKAIEPPKSLVNWIAELKILSKDPASTPQWRSALSDLLREFELSRADDNYYGWMVALPGGIREVRTSLGRPSASVDRLLLQIEGETQKLGY